jgi:hypothetical protein
MHFQCGAAMVIPAKAGIQSTWTHRRAGGIR